MNLMKEKQSSYGHNSSCALLLLTGNFAQICSIYLSSLCKEAHSLILGIIIVIIIVIVIVIAVKRARNFQIRACFIN